VLIHLRNVAIIALLALAVTVLPAGGNVVEGLLTALMLMFIAAIGLLIGRLWKQTSFTRDAMDDRQRALFYGALGAIALMVAGLDEMWASGAGTVAWLAIVAISGYLLYTTWQQANSY
jgi:Kef-type K+ transport system membrane component KefB